MDKYRGLRAAAENNHPILLVFWPLFRVALTAEDDSMQPLMRLEYEPKSCAILGRLFPAATLKSA